MTELGPGLRGQSVRTHNLGLVLAHLQRAGAASRGEIAATTGLVPSAISMLVAQLESVGLVRPVAEQPTGDPRRRGRRAELLEIDGSRLVVVGVQITPDRVEIEASDLAARVLLREERLVRMPTGDPAAAVDAVVAVVEEVAARLRGTAEIIDLELVVPAPVAANGSVPIAVDLGWRDVHLADLVRARLPGHPGGVTVRNDAKAAIHAEVRWLERLLGDVPVTDVVYLTADAGIGGGAMVGGRLLRGATGRTFEPGHLTVVPDGEPCACGRRGCLVTVAGAAHVLDAAGLEGVRLAAGTSVAVEALVNRVRDGDPRATAAAEEALGWIRLALTNICVLLSPQVIVLGGHLSGAADELGRLDDTILGRLGAGELRGRDAVLPSRLGNGAALEGAMQLARAELLARPDRLRALAARDPRAADAGRAGPASG